MVDEAITKVTKLTLIEQEARYLLEEGREKYHVTARKHDGKESLSVAKYDVYTESLMTASAIKDFAEEERIKRMFIMLRREASNYE